MEIDDSLYDAQCFQREQEERRRHEEELLYWSIKSMRSFRREIDEWMKEFV